MSKDGIVFPCVATCDLHACAVVRDRVTATAAEQQGPAGRLLLRHGVLGANPGWLAAALTFVQTPVPGSHSQVSSKSAPLPARPPKRTKFARAES